MADAIHITPWSGKWALRLSGRGRARKLFAGRSEALSFAVSRIERPIYVHDDGGRICEVIR